jgi:rubrerythrin
MEDRLKEELHDVVHYCKMSREAECEHDRRIFKDIAKDEYSHAKHIAEMMKEHGTYVEPTMDWEIATEALHKLDW